MDATKQRMLSLVIPVFNEQEVLKDSFVRMDTAMQKTGYAYEIIYVNDGSRDHTLDQLRELAAEHEQVKVLSFSRNFGHQLAVTCGMDAAKGDALIIIDVDLQDPPELIPEMVRMWESGADIVYGKRLKRKGETFFKKTHREHVLSPACVDERIPDSAGHRRFPFDRARRCGCVLADA